MKIKNLLLTLPLVFILGCQTAQENPNAAKGVGIGAGVGAVVGGIIGHQTGKQGAGAAIGAAVGASIGGYAGRRLDQQKKEMDKIAETKRTEQGLVTKLKSDILFDTGKADLKDMAEKNITELGEIIKKYPENVLTIKGYTDKTGSKAINESLSAKRAAAVKEQIVAAGVPADTISVVGMGPANPVAAGSDKASLAKNRRVEIEITVDESKIPKEKK